MVTSHQSLMFLPPRTDLMSCMIWMTFNIYHMSARPCTQHYTDASPFFFPLQLTAYSSCIARILNWRQQFRFLRSLGSFHRSFFQSYHSVSQGNFTFLVRVALGILKLELLRERERETKKKMLKLLKREIECVDVCVLACVPVYHWQSMKL